MISSQEDEDTNSFDAPKSNCSSTNSRWNETLRFPRILHRILNDADLYDFSHIISWLPDQRSFKVKNNDLFVQEVLPVYCKQTRFKSFQRQCTYTHSSDGDTYVAQSHDSRCFLGCFSIILVVNLWGFERVHNGPNTGAYTHMYFVRDQPNLCQRMKRTIKSKRARTRTTPPAVSRTPMVVTPTRPPKHVVPNSVDSNRATSLSPRNSARVSVTPCPSSSPARQPSSTSSSKSWKKLFIPALGEQLGGTLQQQEPEPSSMDELFDEEAFSTVLQVLPACPRNCISCTLLLWQQRSFYHK
eukprot:Nitzschia sp. Nitz4//scaffold105_size73764//32019//32915//NITZ4_005675-RA/size73764-exonerate_protein2genome-gene-0.15-mRNA-1//-1//CDS//3329532444//7224//frame0